jgi:hypothetical protein
MRNLCAVIRLGSSSELLLAHHDEASARRIFPLSKNVLVSLLNEI